MGRQVQKEEWSGWRGGWLAYLARPWPIYSVVALTGLLFDAGVAAIGGVQWALGREPRQPVAAVGALVIGAALCVAAMLVRSPRRSRWAATCGAVSAMIAAGLFWPSIGPPG
jgi:hypothetical protein